MLSPVEPPLRRFQPLRAAREWAPKPCHTKTRALGFACFRHSQPIRTPTSIPTRTGTHTHTHVQCGEGSVLVQTPVGKEKNKGLIARSIYIYMYPS